MLWGFLNTIKDKEKNSAIEELIKDSTPDLDFYILTILSILMAVFGLISDSEAVVIGSMLLAPIMSPIAALSLGLVVSSPRLITRSARTIVKATGIAIFVSFVTTLIFSVVRYDLTDAILARTNPDLISFFIAVVAAVALVYSMVKKELSEILPGVALAVALMPPLATIGIGLAHFNLKVFSGALLLYLVNIIGIVFATMLFFMLAGFFEKRKKVEAVLNEEHKRLKEEQKIVQNGSNLFEEITKENDQSQK